MAKGSKTYRDFKEEAERVMAPYFAYRETQRTIESLTRELKEANETIAYLRRQLGSNHPDGERTSILFR